MSLTYHTLLFPRAVIDVLTCFQQIRKVNLCLILSHFRPLSHFSSLSLSPLDFLSHTLSRFSFLLPRIGALSLL